MKSKENFCENIVIIYGGKSVEHDISIITGLQVVQNIDKNNRQIFQIYVDKDGKWYLIEKQLNPNDFINLNYKKLKDVAILPNTNFLYKKSGEKYKKLAKINCVILATHGVNGEDGSIYGLFQLNGIAVANCNLTSSAICMDKEYMKDIFNANDFPHIPYGAIYKNDFDKNFNEILADFEIKFNYPMIVKPANLGSSIGINIIHNAIEFKKHCEFAFIFDKKIIIEKALTDFFEINCACMVKDGEIITSKCETPVSLKEFLTYEEKYMSKGKIKNNNKQGIKKSIEAKIKKLTKQLYKKFNCSGVIRIDFLFDNLENKLYVNELNTIPGSFANYLFEFNFKQLIDYLIIDAYKNKKELENITFCFESNVLNIKKDLMHLNKSENK